MRQIALATAIILAHRLLFTINHCAAIFVMSKVKPGEITRRPCTFLPSDIRGKIKEEILKENN